jgi:glucose dehydrogenase
LFPYIGKRPISKITSPDLLKALRRIESRGAVNTAHRAKQAAGFATPAVYSVDGQQFVVIAAGGGRMGPPSSSEYLAYRLPQ